MIDIHRGVSSEKTNHSDDGALASASFVITACMANGPLVLTAGHGSAFQLFAQYDGSWDVRLRLQDRELPIDLRSTSQSSPSADSSWLRLSLPDDLPPNHQQDATSPQRKARDHVQVLGLDVLFIAKPWHEPFASRHLIRTGRRTICVAAAGERNNQYYDGPIIHIRPDGDVGSLIPSGGHATLRVPAEIVAGSRGVSWDEALTLDEMSDDKVHRCLLARVDAYLTQHRDELLSYDLARPSASAASLMVLLRQARPEVAMEVHIPAEALGAHRGPWRRLGQNIGVDVVDGSRGKKSSSVGPRASLPIHLIEDPWTVPLMRSINRISDVIPRSLIP